MLRQVSVGVITIGKGGFFRTGGFLAIVWRYKQNNRLFSVFYRKTSAMPKERSFLQYLFYLFTLDTLDCREQSTQKGTFV